MSITSTGASDWEKPGGRSAGTQRVAFSVPETAELLGVSEASIWRAVKRGDLEAVKFGGRTLITARGIERVVAPQGEAVA